MTSEAPRTGASASSEKSGRVRLRDVLRLDVPKLHAAFTSAGVGANAPAKLLFKLLDEHRSPYKMRILYCPPLPLLWGFASGDGSDASVVHRAYARALWRERGLLGRLGVLASFLLWPTIILATTLWFTALNGAAVRRRTGKGAARQAGEQLWLAARHAIAPPWYYMFELFDDARRAKAGQYLRRDEMKGGLYRLLKRPRTRRRLKDKSRFAERCRERGVAIPQELRARGGRLSAPRGAEPVLPEADLFVKPSRAKGGRGTEVWIWDGGGWSRDGSGRLGEAELREHLEAISKIEDHVVQLRLANHADLADLGGDVLATVRVLTCRDEAGGYEVTDAVFRMPKGPGANVDNFHAGGVVAAVDIRSGELGPATDLGLRPDSEWWQRHPHSGAQIQGRKLPFWQETLDLARRAHAAFTHWAAIGWDIAIVDDGPVVIEGNSGPDVDIIQRAQRAPLGDTRFAELIALQLTRALAPPPPEA